MIDGALKRISLIEAGSATVKAVVPAVFGKIGSGETGPRRRADADTDQRS